MNKMWGRMIITTFIAASAYDFELRAVSESSVPWTKWTVISNVISSVNQCKLTYMSRICRVPTLNGYGS